MLILSIETSCDETACAITENGNKILANIIYSQIAVHQAFGGVLPEIASRCHAENITIVIDEALKEAKVTIDKIDLIAVTEGPGLIGSLLVGVNAAKALALAHNIPLIGVNHLSGHIYAATASKAMIFPVLALVVSGGHTELILMKGHHDFQIIGKTLDDAAGEAYDKIARVLGLGYPGGPIIDELAHTGKDTYSLPRVFLEKDSYDFSFSGLKSSVINLVNQKKMKNENIIKEDLCASFQESVTEVLVEKTFRAAKEFNVKQVIIAGGVAANKGLRTKLINKISDVPLILPPLILCTDNAAMIGLSAYYLAKKNKVRSDLSLNAYPDSEL